MIEKNRVEDLETTKNRYLSFSLGEEEYAIPLLSVKEVIALPEITPIPYTPPYFLGIMNLRGQVISVLDLRLKLNIKAAESSETAVIICDLDPVCLGLVVDSINSVLSPKDSEISPRPEVVSNRPTDYLTGVYRKDSKLVLLLDITKSLNIEDHTAIKKAGPAQKAA